MEYKISDKKTGKVFSSTAYALGSFCAANHKKFSRNCGHYCPIQKFAEQLKVGGCEKVLIHTFIDDHEQAILDSFNLEKVPAEETEKKSEAASEKPDICESAYDIRDKKTGEVFSSTASALGSFCTAKHKEFGGNCERYCPIQAFAERLKMGSCKAVFRHPFIDDYEQAILDSFNLEKVPEKAPESKPQKPRICEVLGVEPGEWFEIFGKSYKVLGDGRLIDRDGSRQFDYLVFALNEPEQVKHLPQFIEEEKAALHLFKEAFPWANFMTRTQDGLFLCEKRPKYPDIGDKPYMGNCISISPEMFPTLKDKQVIRLKDYY